MPPDETSWIALRSRGLTARIDPLGAQLSELRDGAGRDLLWNGDPAVWAGRAPILFPIVGNLAGGRYRVGPNTYALPRHGFARVTPFEVVGSAASQAILRLRANNQTLQVYPFHFELEVEFALNEATLSVVSTVRNIGSDNMPASIGYHPGLRWPLPYGQPRDAHGIEFELPEDPSIKRLDAAGLLSATTHPTPVVDRRLQLEDSLFREDVVIFDPIRSRCVRYGAAAGPRLRVDFPDARYLGLWTRPQAGFICIEPWQGIADETGYHGDFYDKQGVFVLAPGASRSLTLRITLEE